MGLEKGINIRLGFGPVVGNIDNINPKANHSTAIIAIGRLINPV